jgi:hypothetical protein
MATKKTAKLIKAKVTSMTPTELRLMAEFAGEELTTRRDNWVEQMYKRFSAKEDMGMACAVQMFARGTWATDRVVVTCFTSKNRSNASVGVARLSPNDEFDYRTGVAIAFARAMGEPVPDLF